MDTFWNNRRCVQLNHKPWHDFVDESVQKRDYKYDDITSTTFDTETQNVRRVSFPSLPYVSLFGK